MLPKGVSLVEIAVAIIIGIMLCGLMTSGTVEGWTVGDGEKESKCRGAAGKKGGSCVGPPNAGAVSTACAAVATGSLAAQAGAGGLKNTDCKTSLDFDGNQVCVAAANGQTCETTKDGPLLAIIGGAAKVNPNCIKTKTNAADCKLSGTGCHWVTAKSGKDACTAQDTVLKTAVPAASLVSRKESCLKRLTAPGGAKCKWLDCNFAGREDDWNSYDSVKRKKFWEDVKECRKMKKGVKGTYTVADDVWDHPVKGTSVAAMPTTGGSIQVGQGAVSNGVGTEWSITERGTHRSFPKAVYTNGEFQAAFLPEAIRTKMNSHYETKCKQKSGSFTDKKYIQLGWGPTGCSGSGAPSDGTIHCLAPFSASTSDISFQVDHGMTIEGCPNLCPDEKCNTWDPDSTNCRKIAGKDHTVDMKHLLTNDDLMECCKGPLNVPAMAAKMAVNEVQGRTNDLMNVIMDTSADLIEHPAKV
jgi:hypothetical protein